MELYLYDDRIADEWHPFSLTRPVGELLFGSLLLRERLERYAGCRARGSLTRAWLRSYREQGAPPALPRGTNLPSADRLLLCTRAVPADAERFAAPAAGTMILRIGGEIAGCYLPAGQPDPEAEWLLAPETHGVAATVEIEVEGAMLPHVWTLIDRNPERLAADLATVDTPAESSLPRTIHRLGSGGVALGADVALEPGVVLDTRRGAIRLDAGVQVRAGTRLEGPLYAGPGSRLLGGSHAALSAGPRCTLRGEIEATTVLGYANKAHDGFLGHAYVGRWVNLGALTTNSDLKNNYGPVRAGTPEGTIDTGLLKVGCLLGDHVKTAIGTMINAGTVVGAGANLFGAGVPPKWVEPFSWGYGAGAAVYHKAAFLSTASVVMSRRAIECDSAVRAWLSACWETARGVGGEADPLS